MSGEQELEGVHVAGDVRVRGGEQFEQEEEHVHGHGVGHDLGQGLDGLFAHVVVGHLAHEQGHQQQDGRSGAEGRGQEAGGQDGGQPVVPAREALVQEGRHRMDGEGPDDGGVHEGLDPLGRLHVVALMLQADPADDDVQQQVAVEHDHVPEQNGVGRGIAQHVEHAHGLAQVHHDEAEAHDDRGDGLELGQDDHLLEVFVMMEVVGQHDHHAGSGDADQVGELGDVEAPGHIPAQAGDGQAHVELPHVHGAADAHDGQEDTQPAPVARRTFQCGLKHGVSPYTM